MITRCRTRAIWFVSLLTFLARAANAQDVYERSPLMWGEVEAAIRRFADVEDDGPPHGESQGEWQRAWPLIEDAYLAYLVSEEARRSKEHPAIAEAYETLAISTATAEETDRFFALWWPYLLRAERAEEEFLRSIETILPPASAESARDALRARRFARVAARCEGNEPSMPRALGMLLDAPLSAESKRRAREVVRNAEEAMLPHVAALLTASAERRRLTERGAAMEAWVVRANPPLDEAARAERVKELHRATLDDVAGHNATIGEAHAAIERIGVNAALGFIETLDAEERPRALAAIGTPRFSFALAATMRYYERRLASIEHRFPPSDSARALIDEATRQLRAQTDALAVQGFKALRENAALVGQHLSDIDAGRPSSWLAALNDSQARESAAFDLLLKEWSERVRQALGVPKESRWPRHDRNAQGEPIVEEPTPAEVAERELADEILGFPTLGEHGAPLVDPLPSEADVLALASRLGLDPIVQSAWAERRNEREQAWSETIAPEADDLVQRVREETLDDASEVARCHALVAQARAIRGALAEDLLRAVPDERRASLASVTTTWMRRYRLPYGQSACRRVRRLSGCVDLANVSAVDWVGNPLEALEKTSLGEDERASVEASTEAAAAALVAAEEAMPCAEASLEVDRIMDRAWRRWNDLAPIDERRVACEEAWAKRAEVLRQLAPSVRRRAEAAAALRVAIEAALPEARRAEFVRANFELSLPGIDRERPRFERPFLAALGMTGSDVARSRAVVEAYTAWSQRWNERSDAIARVGGGTGYVVAVSDGGGSMGSAETIHAAAMVRWMEIRRREESIIAMRRLERLLSNDEAKALPAWSIRP